MSKGVERESKSVRKKGIVKWFDDGRGYGFILCDSGEYFVHWKDIIMKGRRVLETGDKVSFVLSQGEDRPHACDVIKED